MKRVHDYFDGHIFRLLSQTCHSDYVSDYYLVDWLISKLFLSHIFSHGLRVNK